MTIKKLHKLLEQIIKAGHGSKHVVIHDTEWGHMKLDGDYEVGECDAQTFFGEPTELTGKQVIVLS